MMEAPVRHAAGRDAVPALGMVIVNWNSGPFLRGCLESLSAASRDGFVLTGIVVVDNASSDGSCDCLEDLGLPVSTIRNDVNRGFAAACNQGAARASGDYVLFLNPDTRLFVDSLSKPIAFMEQPVNGGVGICGIQLVDERREPMPSCGRFPTPWAFLSKALGLCALWPSVFRWYQMSPGEYEGRSEVDQVLGAFFLVRRSVFDALRGFDERFFVYFEEVDFSLRARRLGYRSMMLKDVTAYHRGGVSSEQVRATRLFYSLRSRIRYGREHYSAPGAFLVVLTALVPELAGRMARAVARGSLRELGETISAYGMFVLDVGRRALSRLAGSDARR